MLSYLDFLVEKSIRQGLPHVKDMDHSQFASLVKTKKVHVADVTEKTDGMTHQMGHDEHGFYTQSSGSGSEKMRKPEDYHERATRRAKETGKPLDLTAAHAFAHVHQLLQNNKGLQKHLADKYQKTKQETKIKGEVFYKPMARPSEEHHGEIKFVGTSYHPGHMGSVGKYVIHSKLPDNKEHKPEDLVKHSTPELNFDHDKVEHKPVHVDVSKEHEAFHSLDHGLLSSRTTKTNKSAKLAEVGKFAAIKSKVAAKVDKGVASTGVKPKWGSGSEGLVVHPSEHNPDAPRFKVTSPEFRKFKADTKGQDFKARNNAPV
jgi:hypothetical protein